MNRLFDHLGDPWGLLFGLTVSAKATVLLLIAALYSLSLRRRSAAARHLLWTTAMLGALAVPVVSRLIPTWPLAVAVPSAFSLAKPAEPTPRPDPSSRPRSDHAPSSGGVTHRQDHASALGAPIDTAPGDQWSWLGIVWVSSAAVSVLPLVVGLLSLGIIARRATPVVAPEWVALARELSDRLGLHRQVRLLRSNESTMPMTWGWLRPVVLLPRESESWPKERRCAVLLHELAHVKRLDCLTQQLAQLSCAVYWFNPLAWWALMQMRVERERACDDLVLLSGLRPSEYAAHLLALVREQRKERGVSVAAVAMAQRASLEGRLRAILDARATPRRLGRWAAVCGLLAAAAAVASLAGLRLEAVAEKVKGRPSLPEGQRTTVRGRVIDAEGHPVAGARVALLAILFRPLTDSYENTIVKGQALADNQGQFRLDLPRAPDGDKTIVATAPGLGAGFSAVSGSDDEETSIRLGPEQVVRGRFTDSQGIPAAGVAFRVSALWTRQPEVSSVVVTTPLPEHLPPWLSPLRSDAQGHFTLRGLPRDADLTLQVRDDRFALQELRVATGHDESVKETVFPLSSPHLLEGRVTFGDSGQPVAGAELHVVGYPSPTTIQSFDRIDGQTAPDGRYRISASVAHHYGIVVDPPQGSPYFLRRLTLDATAGVRQELNVALHRGILVRGQIHELGSGQPVGGAIVVYRPKRTKNPSFREDLFATGEFRELAAVSGVDGSFQIAALPGQGHLLVKAPNSDFVPVRTSEGQLEDDPPSGSRLFPDGLLALSLGATAKVADVRIPIRRGATLKGRVVGPDGSAVPSATIYSEAIRSTGFTGDFSDVPIEDGVFTLGGLDPDKSISAFVFDATRQLGTALELSFPKDGQPLTVTLQPCGSARVRFVNRAGNPFANVTMSDGPLFGLEMAIRLTSFGDARDQTDKFATTLVDNIDGARYQTLRTDAQGQISFPSLIPGATYRVMAGERGWVMKKEFVAEAGKTVNLPDVTIMLPDEKLGGSTRVEDAEITKP